MVELASNRPGFLGVERVREVDGFGITVTYWSSEKAIAAWKAHAEHKPAQEGGKRVWYAEYQLGVAKVERAYGVRRRWRIKTVPRVGTNRFAGAIDKICYGVARGRGGWLKPSARGVFGNRREVRGRGRGDSGRWSLALTAGPG